MKIWAVENGATHFTHWFMPMTGSTAEKHDAFLEPDGSKAHHMILIMVFSYLMLLQYKNKIMSEYINSHL